jgi:hypothetical protein
MSNLWVSAAQHYPVYEVGDTSDWDQQPDPAKYQATRYGDEDKVPPEALGLPRRPGFSRDDVSNLRWHTCTCDLDKPGISPHCGLCNAERPGEDLNDTRVPTTSLQASQSYLYAPHVRNLAKLPAAAFHETHDHDPISVVRTKDGHHVVMEGHHRAAAAIMRGDHDVRVQVEGVEQ